MTANSDGKCWKWMLWEKAKFPCLIGFDMVTKLRATSHQISASDPPGLGLFVANLIIVGVTSDAVGQGVPLQSLRHSLETRRATGTPATYLYVPKRSQQRCCSLPWDGRVRQAVAGPSWIFSFSRLAPRPAADGVGNICEDLWKLVKRIN